MINKTLRGLFFLFFTVCKIDRSYPNWVVKNLTVDFHDRGYGAGWYAEVSWSPFTGNSKNIYRKIPAVNKTRALFPVFQLY